MAAADTKIRTVSIALKPISADDLRQYIELAFCDDNDLLTRLHISPGTSTHCVDHTLGLINESREFYGVDMEVYAIILDEKTPIGFTVLIKNESIPNELYSFGININHRNQENLLPWLGEIKERLGDPYYVVLWKKNERAVSFFKRNGFVEEVDSNLLSDETKILLKCQQEDC